MGTGGIPAMISAAENGAPVLGIDRQGTPHNVREDIGAIDSRLQQASFDEFPEFRIEKKEAVEDIVRYANGFVNYDLVKLWADESGAMVDWLTDIIQRDGKLVMEFEGGVGDTSDPGRDKAFATGHSPQKTDAVAEDEEWGFAESILTYAAEQGAEVRWYTEFIKCETDESGRVTGVIARDVQGERPYLRINASKGVILSTGGYGNNLEMMEDRQAWNQKIRIAAPGSGGNPTGSGIKAALWLGATMDPLGAACTFNRACVKPDQYAGDGVLGRWFWFGEQPFLKVNLNGERFCNEPGPYDYMLHSTIMQPHQTYVDIWDANHAAQAEAFDEVGCCRLFPFPNGAKNNIPMQVVDGMIEKLIEDGYVQKAGHHGGARREAEPARGDHRGLVEALQRDGRGRRGHRLLQGEAPPDGHRHAALLRRAHRGVVLGDARRRHHRHEHAPVRRERRPHRGPVPHRQRLGRLLLGELPEPADGPCLRAHHDLRPPRRHAGGNRAGVRRPRLQGPFAFASRLFRNPRRQFVKPFPRDTAGRASPPATSGYKSEPPVPCGQGVFACRMEGSAKERKGATWKRNALQKRRAPRAGSSRCF